MNLNKNQSSDGIELLFDRWIVRTGWGEINCDVGQVRYNNPVPCTFKVYRVGEINHIGQVRYNNPILIDNEESSSPRLADQYILVV